MAVYSILAFIDKDYWLTAVLVIVCIILVLILILTFSHALKTFEKFDFSITSAEPSDRESVVFLLIYILPLLRFSVSEINWIYFGASVIVFVWFTAAGYNYHFNPILRLQRWHFYKVSTEEGVMYVLITKKQLRNVAEAFSAIQLTEYVIVDIERSQA